MLFSQFESRPDIRSAHHLTELPVIALHLRGLAFAACLAAATLAAPPAMADQGEDYLLQELRKTNLKWMAPGGEPEILGIGYDICNDWAAGCRMPTRSPDASARPAGGHSATPGSSSHYPRGRCARASS